MNWLRFGHVRISKFTYEFVTWTKTLMYLSCGDCHSIYYDSIRDTYLGCPSRSSSLHQNPLLPWDQHGTCNDTRFNVRLLMNTANHHICFHRLFSRASIIIAWLCSVNVNLDVSMDKTKLGIQDLMHCSVTVSGIRRITSVLSRIHLFCLCAGVGDSSVLSVCQGKNLFDPEYICSTIYLSLCQEGFISSVIVLFGLFCVSNRLDIL